MDPDSPFATQSVPLKTRTNLIFVNFCDVCHYVWKAPAETKICINCKGNGETVKALVSYSHEVPIT